MTKTGDGRLLGSGGVEPLGSAFREEEREDSGKGGMEMFNYNLLVIERLAEERIKDMRPGVERARLTQMAGGPRKIRTWRLAGTFILGYLLGLISRMKGSRVAAKRSTARKVEAEMGLTIGYSANGLRACIERDLEETLAQLNCGG